MMMQHIDRSRSTGGGMAVSFALHGGLLLLLAVMIGTQAAIINDGGELTEIAYIEAKYGEDVAAKVKLKESPRKRPEPPGRGVNTDSAMKVAESASPESPGPEPRPAQQPKPKMTAPPKVEPAQRRAVATADVSVPTATPTVPPKTLATATQLAAKAPQPQTRKVIDASRLSGSLKNLSAKEIAAPAARAAGTAKSTFKPQPGGLKSKAGTVALGKDVLAGAGTSQGTARVAGVAEGSSTVAAGGSLKSAGRQTYRAPSAGLAPARGGSSGTGGRGVVDVDGPRGSGGGKKSGRKTILNYGSGGGGRGGSLSGRQRIAEPATKQVIVAQTEASESAASSVAEVKLDGKGVNMTISGQIQGRKILKSVPPVYTTKAKQNGWEGVVAVHFTVKADGRVKDNMYFEQTSVHRDLNKAAMAAIKQFVFAPLGADQAAVEQWGVITIVFRLK